MARRHSRETWRDRPAGMWRYRELLPLPTASSPVSLGEGGTPLVPVPRVAAAVGLERVYVKDEALQPTLTFKARGASLGVSMAKTLGYRDVGLSTTGSAGTAWAAYCARAGLRSHLTVPASVPLEVEQEAEGFGAEVRRIPGTIVEAGRVMEELVEAYGWYSAEAFREPFRLEGKKTLGFELTEHLGWRVPSVVVFPTGGGIGPLGMAKGFEELQTLGWIDEPLPRIVLVQAAGCAPIVKAHHEGRSVAEPWRDPQTLAKGIRVPATPADSLLLELLKRTGGTAIAVSDQEMLEAQRMLSRDEGISACPEGAAGIAALRHLTISHWLTPSETVVVVNTGSGFKPGAARPDAKNAPELSPAEYRAD